MKTNNNSELKQQITAKKPSLVLNALSNWLSLITSLIVGFIVTPIIIQHLGKTNFGIWSLISMITGYYGLLELGIHSATIRYLSRYAGRNEYNLFNRAFSTSLTFFTLLGILVIFISCIIPLPLSAFFNIEAKDLNSFKYLLYLMGISMGLFFPANIFQVVLRSHERFILINAMQIIFNILRGCLTYYALYMGGGLVHLGLVNATISLIMFIANYIAVKIKYKQVLFSLSAFDKSFLNSFLAFGFFTTIIVSGDILRFKLDEAVLGKFLSMEAVGIYAVAGYLFRYLVNLSSSTSNVTQPRLAALAGHGISEDFSKKFLQYSIIISIVTSCMGVVAYIACEDFMKLWLPANFNEVPTSSLSFKILLIGLIPDMMTGVSVHAMYALKKHRYYAYQTIIEGIFNLTISIILVKYFGIIGVALGSAIPCLITRFIFQPIYIAKIIAVNYSTYIIHVLIKPFCIILLFLFLDKYFISKFLAHTYILLVVKSTIIVIIFTIISYIVCLDKENKNILRRKIESIKHKFETPPCFKDACK